MAIKATMMLVFVAVTVAVGITFHKRSDTVNGFVLGSFKAGSWLTAFAYGTSYFSAVVFVGYAGQFGWRFGVSAVWIGIGNAIIGSLLAWVVLARRTRLMSRHMNAATMPSFFGSRFASPALRKFASAIAFIFLVPYTASLYNGLSRLFAMAFDLDFTVCIAVMALVTAVYVILGGYTATAVNDFIQGVIMLVGIIAILGGVLSVNGGFLESLKQLAFVEDPVSATPGVFASFLGPDPVSLAGVVILTSVGTWGLPQMVSKFYAIRSEENIKSGIVISTLFAIVISCGCYLLGGFGRLFSGRIDISQGYDSVIPAMISGFSPFMIGLVMVVVFAASVSTLSSLVMACSSTVVLDFMSGTSAKWSEKGRIGAMRGLIAVFIVISSVIAVLQYKMGIDFIAQLMGISWGALAGAFLAPYLYGLHVRWVTKASVFVNFIFSVGVMTANVLARSSFPALLASPINCGAFCMLSGLVIVPLVSLVTKKPDAAVVEDAFSCLAVTSPAPAGSFLSGDDE